MGVQAFCGSWLPDAMSKRKKRSQVYRGVSRFQTGEIVAYRGKNSSALTKDKPSRRVKRGVKKPGRLA
ncbi:uncharacterized protein EpC_23330 [Erwinia pyrifoliae Ep1/96]|nr:uncharacterized protein EpC_23330 [Erwinia pyrifoliae Ep1/96]